MAAGGERPLRALRPAEVRPQVFCIQRVFTCAVPARATAGSAKREHGTRAAVGMLRKPR